MNCENCGAPINEENNGDFCKYCGSKLPKEVEPVTNITNNTTNNTTRNVTINIARKQKEKAPKVIMQGATSQPTVIKKKGVADFIVMAIGILIILSAVPAKSFPVCVVGGILFIIGLFYPPKTNVCPRCGNVKGKPLTTCSCGYKGYGLGRTIGMILAIGVWIIVSLVLTV